MTDDRATAQDGADAMARMHATWTARSLNTLAMNQVAITQLVSTQIGSEALDGTLTEINLHATGALGHIVQHGARNCPRFKWKPVVAYCFARHVREMRHAIRALNTSRQIASRFNPKHGIRTSHRGLDALEAMNTAIVAQFSSRMKELAEDYLQDLDIDDVHFADPCNGDGVKKCRQTQTRDGMALPVKRSPAARADACAAMNFGTDISRTTYQTRGFPRGRGPLTHGGASKQRLLKPHINDITSVGRVLEKFKSAHRSMRLMRPGRWTRFPQRLNLVASQSNRLNSFTRRFDAKHYSACFLGNAVSVNIADLTLRRPMPEFWGIVSGQRTDVVAAQMPPEFKILAYVHKRHNPRVGEEVFLSRSQGQFAYGQAAAYNPEGANMFSQSWRAKLVPADKLDNPSTAGTKLQREGRSSFEPLAGYLSSTSGAGWERLNAH